MEALWDFYEEDALLVIQPGRIAQGKSEIRAFFKQVFAMDITARQLVTDIMQTEDIALFTSRWVAEGLTPEGERFKNENTATSVFRKNGTDKWRLVIDNSFGPQVLETQPSHEPC